MKQKIEGGKKEKRFGDLVFIGLCPGVVIGINKKRKWTYYDVVFEDFEYCGSDFHDQLVTYETVREDRL